MRLGDHVLRELERLARRAGGGGLWLCRGARLVAGRPGTEHGSVQGGGATVVGVVVVAHVFASEGPRQIAVDVDAAAGVSDGVLELSVAGWLGFVDGARSGCDLQLDRGGFLCGPGPVGGFLGPVVGLHLGQLLGPVRSHHVGVAPSGGLEAAHRGEPAGLAGFGDSGVSHACRRTRAAAGRARCV